VGIKGEIRDGIPGLQLRLHYVSRQNMLAQLVEKRGPWRAREVNSHLVGFDYFHAFKIKWRRAPPSFVIAILFYQLKGENHVLCGHRFPIVEHHPFSKGEIPRAIVLTGLPGYC
jgi:hypothetical protein